MTEKQRWLLRDLDAWRGVEQEKIGRYGPKVEPKEPPNVVQAKRLKREAERTIAAWEQARREPWKKADAALSKRYNEVKRIVLFEKTEVALKAIKALR